MKLYYPDTGLLISALDEESQEDLRVNKNLGVYKGALYENFVAEAFIKQKSAETDRECCRTGQEPENCERQGGKCIFEGRRRC